MIRPALLPLALAVALGGCINLAPDYQRPALPVADAWPGGSAAPQADAAEPPAWRDYFADARLRELIELALANNRDLRVAALSIDKARASYRVQSAALLPGVDASAGQTVTHTPGSLTSSGQSTTSRQYSAELGISAWELDFFGRLRNLQDAALQSYFATAEAQRSTQLSLIAELANAWLTLAADRERLALAQETLASQQNSYELTRRSTERGVSSGLDLAQASTSVESARADVASYTTQVAQDHNALRLLAGTDVPERLLPTRLPDDAMRVLGELPVGLPSTVLLRRPDILQAEHTLAAASADIGAARAAFFPTITLTTRGGSASDHLSGLFSAGSGVWSFAPALSLPIFDAGSNQANLDAARASRDIAVADYEKAIQTAFKEVADALATRATLDEQLAARRALVAASEEAYRLSEARFRRGIDSYLTTLIWQRSQYAAQQNLISARLAQFGNGVTLYKVLGGGASVDGAAPVPAVAVR
ncbi:AdeC/AdeK/OprM family multidrug efflux complex outer membrane factor [Plasticicumulans acidivorans]|uniref:Multidrug efflux system outer membrane protein n=1 Tax=Plasticicumulans acidivorans TaxID=886464 RepID=A0A317MTK2_9GAMM|nr:AdeC/AdeK/OprM family multidrug efflux complex outer membrane factor [Plasticicumulans acidivorans]PWV59807.1 multidrug efflux system outer membrane protein [Plasticicumulans acidivorans]